MTDQYPGNEYTDIPITEGILLERTTHGTKTNVRWLVRHHSPTGFEWGYGGSGPADLALNILQNALLEIGFNGPRSEKLWDGNTVFNAAYHWHQDFKWEFVAKAKRDGDILVWSDIKAWLENKIASLPPDLHW